MCVCVSLMVSTGVIKHHGHQQRKSEKEIAAVTWNQELR